MLQSLKQREFPIHEFGMHFRIAEKRRDRAICDSDAGFLTKRNEISAVDRDIPPDKTIATAKELSNTLAVAAVLKMILIKVVNASAA